MMRKSAGASQPTGSVVITFIPAEVSDGEARCSIYPGRGRCHGSGIRADDCPDYGGACRDRNYLGHQLGHKLYDSVERHRFVRSDDEEVGWSVPADWLGGNHIYPSRGVRW